MPADNPRLMLMMRFVMISANEGLANRIVVVDFEVETESSRLVFHTGDC